MKTKYFFLLLTVALLCGAALVYAGGKTEKPEKKAVPAAEAKTIKQVLVGAFDTGPGGNPGQPTVPYSSAAGHTMTVKMFTPLTILDEKGENIVPYAAESWEPNKDFTVWTFKLRKDLKWSDGKPVTAEDVKFTVEFVTAADFAPQNVYDRNLCYSGIAGFTEKTKGTAKELGSVKVLDTNTIQFTLSAPNPRFFANLYRSYILPKHAIDFKPSEHAKTDWWINPKKQVGSGPFHVSDYKADEYLELSSNPYFFMGKPKLDKLVVRFFGGSITSGVLALAAGDVVFTYVNFDDLKTLPETKFNYFSGNSTVIVFFDLNYKKLPAFWKDIRVRQAIMYAIDRKTIVEKVLLGTHSVIPGPFGFPQFYSKKLNWFDYNPDKARQLLKEAGVNPADIKMDIISHSGYDNALNNAALQAVQGYLSQIGITDVKYRFVDVPSFRSVYKMDGDWSITYRGWGAPIFGADPAFLMSNGGGQGGDFSGYDCDSKGFPEALAKVTSAPTTDEYFKALTELNDLHNSLLPELMMWVGNRYGAASKRVKDFHWFPAGGGGPYMDHAEKWYMGE